MVNKKTVGAVANIAIRLLVICLAVAALTAFVYAVTKAPIEAGERTRKEAAIRLIFADAAGFTEDASVVGEGVNAVYAVRGADDTHLGWCVDYTGNSDYGGAVNMMIGIGRNGKVIGLQVISHAETFIDRYLDDENRYTGVESAYGADLSAGATMSYNAIRQAITAVEALFVGHAVVDGSTPHKDPARFEAKDVTLLFADAADWSAEAAVDADYVNGVRVVKNGIGEKIGHVVHYTATGGYCGNAELLLAVENGTVSNILVLGYADDRMYLYLDENSLYNGADAVAKATKSHKAIQNAKTAVEALQLGGAQ